MKRFIPYWILCCSLTIFCSILAPAQAASPILTASFKQTPQEFDTLSERVKIILVASFPTQERENITVNQPETYQAFTVCQPLFDQDGCQEKLFIEEISTGNFYQVQGLPLPWRHFTNISWTSETTLEFDRWSNPHYSLRYTIDMAQKKLVNISAFEES